MKKVHALVEKSLCAVMSVGLVATLAAGTSTLGRLKESKEAVKTPTVGTEHDMPALQPVEESEVLKELESGYRPMDDYATIVERNPFARFEPKVVKGESDGQGESGEKKKSPAFIYRGMASVGSIDRAILEEQESKEVFFVASGGQVGGYKVLDITQDTVILSLQDGQEITIKLAE